MHMPAHECMPIQLVKGERWQHPNQVSVGSTRIKSLPPPQSMRCHHPNQFSSQFLPITNVMCYKCCACHVAYSRRLSRSTGWHALACAVGTGAVGTGFLLLASHVREEKAHAQYASLFDADSPSLLLQLSASLDTHALSLSRSLVLRMNGMGKVCKL